jgi:hypothetical protein
MTADRRPPTADLTVRVVLSITMHVRSTLLSALLLFAGAQFALAESPLPEPVPPAVIGRPLDQLKPARPVRPKPAATKPLPSRDVAARPAAPGQPGVRQRPASPHAVPPGLAQSAPHAAPSGLAQNAPASQRPAKKAIDDRADPRMRLDDVGTGTHFARKPLGPGVFFGDKHRTAVRRYYAEHPASGSAAHWQIGEPVPRGVSPAPLPKGLLASLPQLPPGYRYIELGGEVVMVAAQSNLVVDGISRSAR